MKRFSHRTQGAIAIGLCMVAGFVDAVGYLRSEVFVANMTGNTVLIGIALAKQEWAAGSLRVATVTVFFGSAVAGRLLLSVTSGKQWAPLLIEAMLLALAAITPGGDQSWVLMLAAAMGIQATAVTQFGGVAVSTVVVTSAIARVAERVADFAHRGGKPDSDVARLQARLQAAAWAGYCVGAAFATWVIHLFDSRASLLLPASLLAALALLLATRPD
jgi:uncharacterized membrane protein YoaK (UPF0700 family)